MGDSAWEKEILDELEIKKEQIGPSDFKFYNIGHFPLLAERTEEFAQNCPECKANKKSLIAMISGLPESLTRSMATRRQFEKEKSSIEKHLKKVHKCRFPGFYAATYSLLAIFFGLLTTVIGSKLLDLPIPNKLMLIVLAVLLILGKIAGDRVDRRFFKDKMQL